MINSDLIQSIEALEQRYDAPRKASKAKINPSLTPAMQLWLAYSTFFVISTCSQDGIDSSPRGDAAGHTFRILDEHTIAIPDRRGNNRIDSLRNLIRDPRVGLVFLVPGIEEALRIKGSAAISINDELLNSFADADNATPSTVMLITIHTAFVQNARSIRSAKLWDLNSRVSRNELPDAIQLTKSTHNTPNL